MFRGGVRSFLKRYEDDSTETFYYKARTPNELARYFGAAEAFEKGADGTEARQKLMAKFLADSLCDEAGEPVLTTKEAELIFPAVKNELVSLIVVGSSANDGDLPKD